MLPFTAPPSIETARLRLRGPRPDDLEGLHAIVSDPEVIGGVWPNPITDKRMTRQVLEYFIRRWSEHTELHWMIELKDQPGPIGWMITRNRIAKVFPRCLHLEATTAINTGKFWARSAWGKGYATEAQTALVQWLLAQPGVDHVYALIAASNVKSRRVAEKAGYELVEIIPAVYPNPQGLVPKDAAYYVARRK